MLVEDDDDDEQTMKTKQDPSFPPGECQSETITNINNDLVDEPPTNDQNSSSTMIINPSDSNIFLSSSSSSSSPLLISISPTHSSSPSFTLTTNENDTFEPLVEEIQKKEERKEEDEERYNDDYNLDEEKKNNSSLVYDYHASGILLINDESTQTSLRGQEKKEEKEEKEEEEEERERASSPLPTLDQSNQQQTEDESSLQTLSNDFKPPVMTTNPENEPDEERFNKVEVEEIPDDEEALVVQNNQSIEPTDYIHTDEEPRKKPTSTTSSSNLPTIDDPPIKFDNVFSCYEKALAKVVDTPLDESSTNTRQSVEDPIALRALQRFEQRMNAATKSNKDESNTLAAKGKSSWSGSFSNSRKSLENLLKATELQESRLAPAVSTNNGESSTPSPPSTSQSDSYIRPRKTFEDQTTSSTDDQIITTTDTATTVEEQLQPTAIIKNDDERGE